VEDDVCVSGVGEKEGEGEGNEVRGGESSSWCEGDGGGSAAIRIPSERPSNSWWNVMAVTRDTVGWG
jgi:hypothetical protein